MDVPTQPQEESRRQLVVFTIHVGGVDVRVGEDIKPGPVPASKASIEALPTIKVIGSGNDCSICLDEFKVDEEAREMPCKHVFHSGCVEKWLQIHGSCPVCRYLMPADEEADESRGGDGNGNEGREIGLGVVQSVLAVARLAALIATAGSVRGSEQTDAGQVDDYDVDSSAQDMDCD